MKINIYITTVLMLFCGCFCELQAQYNVLSDQGTAVEITPTKFSVKQATYNRSVGIGVKTFSKIGLNPNVENCVGLGYSVAPQHTDGRNNVFLGAGARLSSTTGGFNVGVGAISQAGNNGDRNVSIGAYTSFYSGPAREQVIIGYQAGIADSTYGSLTIGSEANRFGKSSSSIQSIHLGYRAGYDTRNNDNNIGVGSRVLHSGENAIGNIAVGHEAMNFVGKNSFQNVAIGFNAMSPASLPVAAGSRKSIAIGKYALAIDSVSQNSIAIGESAFRDAKDLNNGIAIGKDALKKIAVANDNIAIGVKAGGLDVFSFGSFSVEVGLNSGSNNIFVGYQSGQGSVSGLNRSTVIGSRAMRSGGNDKFNNTVLGYDGAEGLQTDGSNNTFIGASTKTTKADLYNSMAIGFEAEVNSNNSIVLGNTSVTSVGGYASFTNFSDKRLKTNIMYDNSLSSDFINQLNTYSYYYKKDPKQVLRQGLIAQELETYLTGHKLTFSGWIQQDDQDQTQAIAYETLTIPLINATQSLSKKLDRLTLQISEREKINIDSLSATLNSLSK